MTDEQNSAPLSREQIGQIIGQIPETSLYDFYQDRNAVLEEIDSLSARAEALAAGALKRTAKMEAKEILALLRGVDELQEDRMKLYLFFQLYEKKSSSEVDVKILADLRKIAEVKSKPFSTLLREIDRWPLACLKTWAASEAMEDYAPYIAQRIAAFHAIKDPKDVPYWEVVDAGNRLHKNIYYDVRMRIETAAARAQTPQEQLDIKKRLFEENGDVLAALLQHRYEVTTETRKWNQRDGLIEGFCAQANITEKEYDGMATAVKDSFRFVLPPLLAADRAGKFVPQTSVLPWKEAEGILLSAFDAFSPNLRALVAKLFHAKRVDLRPVLGRKNAEAFASPASRKVLPIVFASYNGHVDHLPVLGHELGHALQHILSLDQPFPLRYNGPAFSEVFSLLGEKIIFESLLSAPPSQNEKERLHFHHLYRQAHTIGILCPFEAEVALFNRSKTENLNRALVTKIYEETRADYPDGNSAYKLSVMDWGIQERMFTGYCREAAYPYAQLVANALWDDYQNRGDAFVGDYIRLMQAGGSKPPREVLKPFGINTEDPAFWQRQMKNLVQNVQVFLKEPASPPTRGRLEKNTPQDSAPPSAILDALILMAPTP